MNTLSKYGSIIIVTILFCAVLLAQRRFPFTKESNKDDAKYVWFMYHQEGMSYEYAPAGKFKASKHFTRIKDQKLKTGDIAWWKDYMAIYNTDLPDGNNLITADGPQMYQDLEKKYGPVDWFRYHAGSPHKDKLRAFNRTIDYTVPDASIWLKDTEMTKVNDMFKKGMLVYLREELIDSAGRPIQPTLSIIYSILPKEVTTEDQFTANAKKARKYDVLKVDYSRGFPIYYYHYKDQVLDHIVVARYIVSNGMGVEVISNSTKETFPLIEQDVRKFIVSVGMEEPKTIKKATVKKSKKQ